jgi:hypothetical protein
MSLHWWIDTGPEGEPPPLLMLALGLLPAIPALCVWLIRAAGEAGR